MRVQQDNTFRQVAVSSCPICGQKIRLAMKVNTGTPGQPSDSFWGNPGARRRICQQGAWFHFVATEEEQEIHRLAYLMGEAAKPDNLPADGEPGVRVESGRVIVQQSLL